MLAPQVIHGVGGIVLCGGKSTRMGRAKATLAFGPENMLNRVVRLLGEVVAPIVVVAAPEQELPPLPPEVLIARDEHEGRGPLEGLLAGLTAIAGRAESAYATSCDVPLLVPGFVRRVVERLAGHDAVVPVDDSFPHPLAAAYRISVAPVIRGLLAADQLRVTTLLDAIDTCRVPVETFRDVDPRLDTLMNLNTPDDYDEALRRAACDRGA